MKTFEIKYKWKTDPTQSTYINIKADSKGDAKRRFIQKHHNVNGGILDVMLVR